MSSRVHVIQSTTITLLLFSQCGWCLWMPRLDYQTMLALAKGPAITDEQHIIPASYHHLQRDEGLGREVAGEVGGGRSPSVEEEYADQQEQQQKLQRDRDFLQGNAEERIIHAVKSNLRNLLEENSEEELPIVYMEENSIGSVLDERQAGNNGVNVMDAGMNYDEGAGVANNEGNLVDEDVIEYELNENGEVQLTKDKRSGRYYRRYPFKRRNNRLYESPKYNCKPSREEVVKLLIALHKYQNGNKNRKMIRFCKRDRPLGNIITNIRFLG